MSEAKRHIVLLGGAGYIGRSLCNLYRLDANIDLTVVDTAFNSQMIESLRQHRGNARFIEGDIGDIALMQRLLVDSRCDICYLLAGQIQAESSRERERLVWEENYEKVAAVMYLCRPETRLFFPSSANVFGGNYAPPDTIYSETSAPQPKYPYAETKAAMESLLAEWNGNYVVARLGTNYGWAPGIRYNLVVNLFSKLAKQGRPLTVHGDGLNYRPFCHNQDCARAIRFLAEHPQTRGKLYHVVSDNWQIASIAGCIKAHSEAKVTHMAERSTFASYRMSSKHIKQLGFTFNWDMETGIKDLLDHLGPLQK